MLALLRKRLLLRKRVRKIFVAGCIISSIITSAFALGNTAESNNSKYNSAQLLNTEYNEDMSIENMAVTLNNISPSNPYNGDIVPTPIDIPQEQYTEYTIKYNDTLWEIAASAYGAGEKWETISRYNEINNSAISVGQVIKIPIDTTLMTNTVTDVIEPKVEVVDTIIYEPEKIDKFTNLAVFKPLTIDQMNNIISGCQLDSPFQGRGDIFIKASEVTGLNPLYIFGHASLESGYGTSRMAMEKHNYFGIGAFDDDPDNAYTLGDSMENGIINGAKWIKEHYYDEGYISLYDMIHTAPYAYASAGDKWIDDIVWIANAHINMA